VKLNVEGFDGFESGSKSMEDGDSAIEPEYYVQQKGMIQTMMSGYVDRIVSNFTITTSNILNCLYSDTLHALSMSRLS
jgi:hypothetical protein